jgi:hypothetical protein
LGADLTENALRTDEIWGDDKIDRRPEAEMLLQFLVGQLELKRKLGREQAYVINVDAPWGSGKTFFLERFARDLRSRGFAVVFFNAWEADHADDPLIAMFAEVTEEIKRLSADQETSAEVLSKLSSLKRRVGAVATRMVAAGLKQAGRNAFGEDGMEAIAEAMGSVAVDLASDKLVDQFESRKKAVADFRQELAELAAALPDGYNTKRPVFIFVDELDRCRPSYAISLLERVKHILAVDGFVFVFGTDTAQLAHSISGQYGAGFDGQGYMKRLFGRTYKLKEPKMSEFITQKFDDLSLEVSAFGSLQNQSTIEFASSVLTHARCTLRDAEQILEKLQTFVTVWPYDGLQIWLPYLLPLIVEDTLSDSQLSDGRRSAWKYTMTVVELNESSRTYMSVERSLDYYRDHLLRFGKDIFGHSPEISYTPVGWIKDAFVAERGKLHNNRYFQDSPPSSVVLDYPYLLSLTAPFASVS